MERKQNMDTLKKQIMEINQLCNESDLGYIMILLKAMGFQTVYIGFYIFFYYNDCPVSQTELCSNWYYSKRDRQFFDFSHDEKGWIMLETVPKTESKNIVLTREAGRIFALKS